MEHAFSLLLRNESEERVMNAFRELSSGRGTHISMYRDSSECSLLHLAALYGRPQLTSTLVLKFPELLEEVDEDQQTALHLAMMVNRNDIATILLSVGANTRALDIYGETPAAKCCESPINYVMMTLFKDAELQPDLQQNAQQESFCSDLHRAYNLAYLEHRAPSPLFAELTAEMPNYRLHRAMFLLEYFFCTANMVAARAHLPRLRQSLSAAPAAEVHAFYRRLVVFYPEDCLLAVLEGGMWYPLVQHDLVAKGYVRAYRRLARQLPMDLEERGHLGNTVLHEACFAAGRHRSCIRLAQRLIQAGASPSATNDAGRTPLEIADSVVRRILERTLDAFRRRMCTQFLCAQDPRTH